MNENVPAVIYDPDADALYLQIRDALATTTVQLDPGLLVDLDAAGAPLGAEVIHPSRDWVTLLVSRYPRFAAESHLRMLEAMFSGVEIRSTYSGTVFGDEDLVLTAPA